MWVPQGGASVDMRFVARRLHLKSFVARVQAVESFGEHRPTEE